MKNKRFDKMIDFEKQYCLLVFQNSHIMKK